MTPTLRDVPYGPDPAQQLDLYLPPARFRRPVPAVLFLHGGAWAIGDKSPCPAAALADLGYAVASVNYRLSLVAPFPAQAFDCKGAVRWVRAHAGEQGIDGGRIGVWGISAGGHLAALLGTSGGVAELEGTVGGNAGQSSRVQAVCDWFGPTDLTRFADDARAAHLTPKREWAALVEAFLGGSVDGKADLAALANPARFVTAAAPPFLILHGDRDDWVPLGQSRRLADALAAAGVRHTFTVVHGGGHGSGFDAPDVRAAVATFFARTLGPNAPRRP